MHRDPRYADIEKMVGALTAAVGGGSVLLGEMLGWQSNLLRQLGELAWGKLLWISFFLIFGGGMYVASMMMDYRLRACLLRFCALLWFVLGCATAYLKMPIAVSTSAVIVYFSLRAERSIRHDR